jgi:acetate kinase
MAENVLSINCGSSSLKYALFELAGGEERARVRDLVEGIGARLSNGAAAIDEALAKLATLAPRPPDAVAHRVVFGGPRSAPARVDRALLAELRALVPFAPLHLPLAIDAMEAFARRWPAVPQVACFDTAFHAAMPEAAWRYAIPLSASGSLRRYGFHGISCEYVVAALGPDAPDRLLIAHLGSGASMTAVKGGVGIDTTMGLTPTGGLVMGTRPGDLDPGIVVYLLRQGYDADRLERLFERESGLLALSETTADVRALLAERGVDPRAKLAVDVFCFQARRWAGALAASLGGLDTLVFTGGIGEHAAEVRAEIAAGLEHLGVRLDAQKNARSEPVISAPDARCTVRVIAADEERMLARHAAALLG